MLNDVLAYFMTFSTYGTWLHGDERGSMLRRRSNHANLVPPNPQRRAFNERMLGGAPVTLHDAMRRTVDAAIREACSFKNWPLRALNVRTNHVHLVVAAPLVHPDRVLSTVKARATFRVREAGLLGNREPLWTEHGSTRWLWNETAVDAACRYVLEQQGPDLV
jgi:REP element-mobilizing transposase RayT